MKNNTSLTTTRNNKIQELIALVKPSYSTVRINKKISDCLYAYCLALNELNCTSYLGTILFNKKIGWLGLNTSLDLLLKYFLKTPNVVSFFITTELHRSRPNRKHSLHGYPHLHFIITYSSQGVLGPNPSKILQELQDCFTDVTFKKITNTTKSLLQAHKYLFKDLPKNDINAFFDLLCINHSITEVYATNDFFLPYLKKLEIIVPNKVKLNFIYKHNAWCSFFDRKASGVEYAFYILKNLLREYNLLHNEGYL